MPRNVNSLRRQNQSVPTKREALFSNEEIDFYRNWMQSKSSTVTGEVSMIQIEMLYNKNRRMRMKYTPSRLSFDLEEILTTVKRKPVVDGQPLADVLNDSIRRISALSDELQEAIHGIKSDVREAGRAPPSNLISILTVQRERKEMFCKHVQDAAVALLPPLETRICELEDLQAQLNNAGDFMSDKGWFAPQPSRGSTEEMYGEAVSALRRWSEKVAAEPVVQATEEALEISREALVAIMAEDDHARDPRMSPDLGQAFAILVERLEHEDRFWTELNPFADLPVHHVRWAGILLRQEIGEELLGLKHLMHTIQAAQKRRSELRKSGAERRASFKKNMIQNETDPSALQNYSRFVA